MLVSVILTVVGLIGSFLLVYFGKPISDFRERRIQQRTHSAAARLARYKQRALEIDATPQGFTEFQLELLFQLIASFGMMILGASLMIIGYVTKAPTASHYRLVVLTYEIGGLFCTLSGSALFGKGFAYYLRLHRTFTGVQAEYKALTDSAAPDEVQNIPAHTPSDPSAPQT